jgi:hypothetical protein
MGLEKNFIKKTTITTNYYYIMLCFAFFCCCFYFGLEIKTPLSKYNNRENKTIKWLLTKIKNFYLTFSDKVKWLFS